MSGSWPSYVVSLGPLHWYPTVPDPPLSELTPAQIHAKYGADIASYIVELRGLKACWERIATERAAAVTSSHHRPGEP
jgi:hypothetical protein